MRPNWRHESDIEENRIGLKFKNSSSRCIRHGKLLSIQTLSNRFTESVSLKLIGDVINADEPSPGHAIVSISAIRRRPKGWVLPCQVAAISNYVWWSSCG